MTKKRASTPKALLSLTGTPWLIFLSTSIPLYMENREDLSHQVSVLLPFVGLAIASVLLAAVVFLAGIKRDHSKVLRRLLWGYYFLGWFFGLMVALHHLDTHLVIKLGLMLVGIALVGYLCIVLERRVGLSNAVGFWAFLSGALILADIYSIVMAPAAEAAEFSGANQGAISPGTARHTSDENTPNIYHFVLDEFQTDMFSVALSDETRRDLAGFTFFPEATTVFGRTDMSIPSVLSGLDYDFDSRQFDYQKSAFNDSNSFIYWLKKKGYNTYAYIHPMWKFKLGLFDHTRAHEAPRRIGYDVLGRTFRQLWIYSNLPKRMSNILIDKADIEQLENQNMLPSTAPLMSYHTMQQILKYEKFYAKSNRYVFAHLILPHFPYVMNKDCSYDPDRHTATPLSQSQCATKLMTDFIEKLKELDRFDSSMIIIQSDHGARHKIEGDKLVAVEARGNYSIPWSIARSRSLLLIKPPGASDDVALTTSYFEASLLDIAPTVNQALGLDMSSDFPGFDLFSQPDTGNPRVRYYHFYEKKGEGGWTDEMVRYQISNSTLSREGSVSLSNNEPGA